MKSRRLPSDSQPTLRSKAARDAWDQTGGGPHGGTSRAQLRKDRKNVKRELRALRYE